MTDMTFESAVKALFDYQMRNVFTAIPAKVMQVEDAGEQRVAVKPLINNVFPDWEDSIEFPTLLSVQLMFPSSSTSAFTFPVNAGDTVLLVFAQSCMDVFKSGDGTTQPPSDYRRFDKRDAIAIPGLFPFGMAINQQSKRTLTHSTDDVVVAHNLGTEAECEIRLKPAGKVEITSPLQVEVNAPIVTVNAETSATVTSPAIYATATTLATITAPIASINAATLATITAPIAAINAATSATVTSPIVAITAVTSVAVTSPTFTWNGSTIAVI